MTDRIRTTNKKVPTIRVTSRRLPRVEPEQVAAALGGEPIGERLNVALAPITLFALRQELGKRLQSNGGRPRLTGTSHRAKIPLREEEWQLLEELATAISEPGFTPSGGQVASVLLTHSVEAVTEQVRQSPKQALEPLAQKVAARAVADSAFRPRRSRRV